MNNSEEQLRARINDLEALIYSIAAHLAGKTPNNKSSVDDDKANAYIAQVIAEHRKQRGTKIGHTPDADFVVDIGWMDAFAEDFREKFSMIGSGVR
ncbi:hypothetical protein [Mesorhizobium sp. M0977]|uniref:hypothetical protein n=1 Tax=Mesorhizobium sp. M0977 TaxID=2957039 RepID=UPI00333D2D02